MNILLYAPNYLPATRYGGPIRSSHGLARALVDLGHKVEVVTTTVDGSGTLEIPNGARIEIDSVGVTYFSVRAPRRIYYAPEMLAYVRREIRKFDIAHINGVYLWPGPAIAGAAANAGVPYIISPRGMLVPEMIAGKSALAKSAWIALFEKRALSRASAIHATSQEERAGIERLALPRVPIDVIANGVDLPPSMPADEAAGRLWQGVPKGERIAFLGRLDWTKGVEIAADAVSDLECGTLLVAGPDQIGLQKSIENNLKIVGAGSRVRFVGALDDEAKWAFLAGADVLVVPSVKESFGLSAAEALAIGKPVLVTEGVGASSIVAAIDKDCVVARNRAALTAALRALLANPARREAFSASARRVMAADYTWNAIARQMSALYERITTEKGQRLAHAS